MCTKINQLQLFIIMVKLKAKIYTLSLEAAIQVEKNKVIVKKEMEKKKIKVLKINNAWTPEILQAKNF